MGSECKSKSAKMVFPFSFQEYAATCESQWSWDTLGRMSGVCVIINDKKKEREREMERYSYIQNASTQVKQVFQRMK